MKKQKQLGFEVLERQSLKYFGGAYLKNSHAKVARPITTKRSMHLVLRALMAKGEFSLLRKERIIKELIYNQAKTFGVRVYRLANGGNHLHLIIMPRSREAFHAFIRSISGLIVREVLGAQRGCPQLGAKGKFRFWDKRPFTRIVEWGREYKSLNNYLDQNALEAWGFIPYQPRKSRFNPIGSTA
ncbi:MAG: transposase [Oligoflexia bacterium]|nr:transposase [Oligoflexia bacterium]